MGRALKEFDARLDHRKRVTLTGAEFENYHVTKYDDGSYKLEPRMLVAPAMVSERTLAMMDTAVASLKEGEASKTVDPAVLRRPK